MLYVMEQKARGKKIKYSSIVFFLIPGVDDGRQLLLLNVLQVWLFFNVNNMIIWYLALAFSSKFKVVITLILHV